MHRLAKNALVQREGVLGRGAELGKEGIQVFAGEQGILPLLLLLLLLLPTGEEVAKRSPAAGHFLF
jgi:hypothetical protein